MCETLISLIVGLSEVSDGDVYESKLKRLQEECEKATPKGSLVKRLMTATFSGRRKWILEETPSISDVLQVFPPLKQSQRVRKQFVGFVAR